MSKSVTRASGSNSADCLTQAVVEIIADLEETRPTELQPTLHSVIDPGALDSLIHSMATTDSSTQGHIGFHYCGYEVSVYSDGEIAVTDA